MEAVEFFVAGDANRAKATVVEALQNRKFRLTWNGDWDAVAERGNKVANVLAGAFAQYFKIGVVIRSGRRHRRDPHREEAPAAGWAAPSVPAVPGRTSTASPPTCRPPSKPPACCATCSSSDHCGVQNRQRVAGGEVVGVLDHGEGHPGDDRVDRVAAHERLVLRADLVAVFLDEELQPAVDAVRVGHQLGGALQRERLHGVLGGQHHLRVDADDPVVAGGEEAGQEGERGRPAPVGDGTDHTERHGDDEPRDGQPGGNPPTVGERCFLDVVRSCPAGERMGIQQGQEQRVARQG
ncbi:MAG: hypothetical protein R2694_02400 [Ilumatobacteraceae bacterium]